jgi:hypothetical protein
MRKIRRETLIANASQLLGFGVLGTTRRLARGASLPGRCDLVSFRIGGYPVMSDQRGLLG